MTYETPGLSTPLTYGKNFLYSPFPQPYEPMTLTIKKRGRPTKAEVAAREAVAHASDNMTDAELLTDVQDRFATLEELTRGAIDGTVRAVTVSGAPGVGKTYTVERILEAAGETRNTKYEVVHGAISPVNLYKLGYRNRHSGSVVVLDDADSIFQDEEALNILKALCDSSPVRRVSWLKESHALKAEDIPTTYEFHGAFIFITNLDFQYYVDMGGNKYAQHFEAIMSRSLYLDLRLHTRKALGTWVQFVATENKILAREGLPDPVAADVLQFVMEHRERLRELSLRTVLKLAQLAKSNRNWKARAKTLLTRQTT